MKIGIVGQGYVGTAVRTVFEKHYDILTYDIDRELSNDTTLCPFSSNLLIKLVPTNPAPPVTRALTHHPLDKILRITPTLYHGTHVVFLNIYACTPVVFHAIVLLVLLLSFLPYYPPSRFFICFIISKYCTIPSNISPSYLYRA